MGIYTGYVMEIIYHGNIYIYIMDLWFQMFHDIYFSNSYMGNMSNFHTIYIIIYIYNWLVVSNMTGLFSISYCRDVIRNPLTNSIIFQDG